MFQQSCGHGFECGHASVAYPLRRVVQDSWFSAAVWSEPRPFRLRKAMRAG